jgi:hypothetical protein
VRAVEEHYRVGLGREPERGQSRDLGVVVGANVEVIESGGPEFGQSGRMVTVDDDLLEPPHAPPWQAARSPAV